jgi:hypothetical protein
MPCTTDKTEPGAFTDWFRGEERIEHTRKEIGRDADAAVGTLRRT